MAPRAPQESPSPGLDALLELRVDDVRVHSMPTAELLAARPLSRSARRRLRAYREAPRIEARRQMREARIARVRRLLSGGRG